MKKTTCLPSSHYREVHGGFDMLGARHLEGFSPITDYGAELLHCACLNRNLRSSEGLTDVDIGEDGVVTVPEFPVELLDAGVVTLSNFVDGSKAQRRLILELEGERNGNVATIFKDCEVDTLGRGIKLDFKNLERGLMLAIRTGGAVERDGGECRAIKSDNDSLSCAGSEKAANGIVDV